MASIVGLNEATIYMCIIIPQNDVDGEKKVSRNAPWNEINMHVCHYDTREVFHAKETIFILNMYFF